MGESPIFQGMMAMFNPAIAGADGENSRRSKEIKRSSKTVRTTATEKS
jgi:hypothetical protein